VSNEDNSLYNSLFANLLSGKKANIAESLKQFVNNQQISVMPSFGEKDPSKQEDVYVDKVPKCALPSDASSNLKRKLSIMENPDAPSPLMTQQFGQAGSSPPIPPVNHRLAENFRDRCRFVEEYSSGMKLYQLPLKRKTTDRLSRTARPMFF